MKKCFYASLMLAFVACGQTPKENVVDGSSSEVLIDSTVTESVDTLSQNVDNVDDNGRGFKIETVNIVNGSFSSELPKLVATDPAKQSVVDLINKSILDNFMLSDFQTQEDFQYNVMFNDAVEDDLLILTYKGDVMGAYSSEIDQSDYYRLSTGEKLELEESLNIPFKNFFASKEMFEKFYNEYWKADIDKAFAEAEECADGSTPYCAKDDIRFETTGAILTLKSNSDCYPHVMQACSPYVEKTVTMEQLKGMLSEDGEYLLTYWNTSSVKDKLAYKCSWAAE